MFRKSAALDKMRSGEVITSFKLNLDGYRVVQLAALHDFDLLWTDMEHTPNSLATIEAQVNAAKAGGKSIIVRVGKGSYSDMIRPLEMDADGIMVPHVASAEEAADIVFYTKFHPLGRRPVDGGNADGAFCLGDFHEYLEFMNHNRMIIIQIEDVEAMDELEDIAQVPGIDMLFFGPGDFSHSLGDPGNFSHPDLLEARRLVAEVARRYDKLSGTTGSPDNFAELAALGYNLINIGADVLSLNRSCHELSERMQKVRQNIVSGATPKKKKK